MTRDTSDRAHQIRSIDDLPAFCSADSDSSKENKDEEEKTYGMGGAMGMISSGSMGMLSSLTTVVQSTVRASLFMLDDNKAEFVLRFTVLINYFI